MAIDAKAKAMRAAGEDVIGFGAGEPDFATPKYIVDAALEAASDAKMHGYTAVAGHPGLREAIAEKTCADTGWEVAPEQVVVTNGAKHALFNALAAVVDPGDEVMIPAPYWVTYPEAAAWLGADPVAVFADDSAGFKVTADDLEAHATPSTKALMFGSPCNPTGAVYSASEVRAIGEWAAGRGIWVITDDIYQDLVYGDAEFSSIIREVPALRDQAIVVNGLSKSFAMTGWRLGWLAAPPDAAKAISRLQGHTTSNVNNVAQAAALVALTEDTGVVEEMRQAFDRRRMRAVELVSAMQGVTLVEPDGAFYVFPSVAGVLGKSAGGRVLETSLDVADYLLDDAGVAVVPGEAFGVPGYLRISYALGDDELEDGLERMARALAVR